MPTIKPLIAAFALTGLLSTPAQAQSPQFEMPDGLPDAFGDALRELMDKMKPALEQAMEMMQSFEGIDDPRHYMVPEVLPNGDIIIRRRPDAPAFKPRSAEPPSPQNGEEGDGVRT